MQRASLLFIAIIACATTATAQTPVHLGSQRFGGTSSDWGYSIATDPSGNVLITGGFSFSAEFGGGPLVSAGLRDVFVAKYAPGGVHLWSQRFGSTGHEDGRCVATDASGNVFVTGWFSGTVDFGGGPLVSAGDYDIFIAKYSPTGAHLWSQRFGDLFGDYTSEGGYGLTTDAWGNVFVSGSFTGTVDFGGGPLVSPGGPPWDPHPSNAFVAGFSPEGTHLWSRGFGDYEDDYAYSIAADANGNVLVTGSFQGSVDIGGGAMASAGSSDIFVAKYDTAGNHLWSHRFGSTGSDVGYSVATDGFDNLFVTGSFSNTADFGGGPLVCAGSSDIFVAKYDPAGVHLWSQRFGGNGSDIAHSIATDESNNVLLTGSFSDTADFGGEPLVSAGSWDIFVVRYSWSGDHIWSQGFGSTSVDFGSAVTTDVSNHVLVTGYFVGTVDFGGGPLVSAGGLDIFLAEYSPDPSPTGVGGTPAPHVLAVTNFPNPFNPSTTLSYEVPSRGAVTVAVYDVRGARLATLVNNEQRDAGTYYHDWQGRDDHERILPSGVYFARIEHAGNTRSRKLLLLK